MKIKIKQTKLKYLDSLARSCCLWQWTVHGCKVLRDNIWDSICHFPAYIRGRVAPGCHFGISWDVQQSWSILRGLRWGDSKTNFLPEHRGMGIEQLLPFPCLWGWRREELCSHGRRAGEGRMAFPLQHILLSNSPISKNCILSNFLSVTQ